MAQRTLVVAIVNGNIQVCEPATGKCDTHYSLRTSGDQYIWKADKQTVKEFDIDFGALSPFTTSDRKLHGDKDTPTSSEPVDSTRPDHDYKYTVTATPKTGPAPPLYDPHIIIGDSGMDIDLRIALETAQSTSQDAIAKVLEVLATHIKDAAPDGKRFFFPFGVQSISVDVKLATIEVNVQVEGTTAG